MLIEYKGYKLFAFADTHGMYRRLFSMSSEKL